MDIKCITQVALFVSLHSKLIMGLTARPSRHLFLEQFTLKETEQVRSFMSWHFLYVHKQ